MPRTKRAGSRVRSRAGRGTLVPCCSSHSSLLSARRLRSRSHLPTPLDPPNYKEHGPAALIGIRNGSRSSSATIDNPERDIRYAQSRLGIQTDVLIVTSRSLQMIHFFLFFAIATARSLRSSSNALECIEKLLFFFLFLYNFLQSRKLSPSSFIIICLLRSRYCDLHIPRNMCRHYLLIPACATDPKLLEFPPFSPVRFIV